jgi:hypothetical protein
VAIALRVKKDVVTTRVARGLKSPEVIKFEESEKKALDQPSELVEHLTIGVLLAAGPAIPESVSG